MGNLLTVLGAVSGQLWENIGLTRAEGIKALTPIMKQVSINLESLGIPEAFAGPYVRGDIGTIQKHLETLQLQEPSVLPLYCELALAGLPFAIEKGTLTQDRAETIRTARRIKPALISSKSDLDNVLKYFDAATELNILTC